MPGKTITVSNATELKKALTASTSTGGTILLNPGDYGSYSFSGVKATQTVTIKSADANNDASFRQIMVTNCKNLVFDDIDVNHPLGVDARIDAISINKSSSISVVGVDLAGSMDGNSWNDGRGIYVSFSDHISIVDSTMTQFKAAVLLSRSSDIIVAGNTITGVNEGVDIAEVTHGLFEKNYIYGMTPNFAAGDHPDAFQVMAANTAASSDLAFRNNVIIATDGPVGGIFIRSELMAKGVEHSNISIENNYYQGTFRHGISVSDTNGVVITGNTVLDSAKAGLSAAIYLKNVDSATIANNIAPMYIQTDTSHVTSTNNIDVWDPKSKQGVSVASLFAPLASGTLDFGTLNPLATSTAAAAGVGFHNVADIGNLSGNSASIIASYAGLFDHGFATHFV